MAKFPKKFPLALTSKMHSQVKSSAEEQYMTISAWVRKAVRESLEKQDGFMFGGKAVRERRKK